VACLLPINQKEKKENGHMALEEEKEPKEAEEFWLGGEEKKDGD